MRRLVIADLRLKANRPDEALAMLQEADRTSRDKETRYLSALQQGWAYTLKQDRPHAIEAYAPFDPIGPPGGQSQTPVTPVSARNGRGLDISVKIRNHPDYKVLVRKGYDGGK